MSIINLVAIIILFPFVALIPAYLRPPVLLADNQQPSWKQSATHNQSYCTMRLLQLSAMSVVVKFGLSSFCQGFVTPPTVTSRIDKSRPQSDNLPQGDAYSRTSLSSSYLLLSLSSASSPQKNGRSSIKDQTKKGKQGNGKKWDRQQRRNHHQRTTEQIARLPPQPRPSVTNYSHERNDDANEHRLVRENINCEHFGSCPGCVVQQKVGQVDIVRSAKRFFSSTAIRKNRMDVFQSGQDWVVEEEDDGFYQVVVPSSVREWRTQAKLVVAPKSSSWAKDGCKFGLFRKGTHEVLDIPNCQVHHPSINRAVKALEQATDKVGTAAYTSDSRDSVNAGLRFVQLQVERTTGKINLTLIWASPELKYTQPGLSRLTKELQSLEPDLWHSVWCHCNDGGGNNIFSRNARNWHRLSGPEFVREPLPVGNYGWLYFSPMAFRQGNMDGFDIIANDVARAVPGGTRVCELYAGVGLLGLTSLVYHNDNGSPLVWVRCSDENPANTRCFSRSLQSLPQEITENVKRNNRQSGSSELTLGELVKRMESGEVIATDQPRVGPKASYMVASAATALKSGQALGAEVLIVDPPRKGLEDEVLEELCKPFNPKQPPVESAAMLPVDDDLVNWVNDVQTLIYVSCGFDALARDCDKILSSRAGWKLISATGYILFPGSNHVETVCVFQRG